MSNLFTRIRTGFYTHRKTAKLKSLIGDDAYWIPPRLWAYAAENQPDGDLKCYTSKQLSVLLGCDKYEEKLIDVLKECGFVDKDSKIHDWDEYNSYHKKFSDRASKAAQVMWEKRKKKPEIGPSNLELGIEIPKSKTTTDLAREILNYLNEKAGKSFFSDSYLKLIERRMRDVKGDVQGIKDTIDRLCVMWKGTKFEEYLRPTTIFAPEKFMERYESRHNAVVSDSKTQHENPDNRNYDKF